MKSSHPYAFPLLLFILLWITICISALNTQVPLWLDEADYSQMIVGWIGSCYFIGNLIGTLVANRFIARFKARPALFYVVLLFGISTVGMSLSFDLVTWSILRLIIGICCAVIWVIIESCILVTSQVGTRAKMLALYMTVYYLGTVLGQFLLNYFPEDQLYFALIVFLVLALSGLLIFATHYRLPLRKKKGFSIVPLLTYPPARMGLLGCVVAGMMFGAFYSLLPAYYSKLGDSKEQIVNMMMILILSGMIAQVPISRSIKYVGGLANMLLLEMLIAVLASVLLYCHLYPTFALIVLGASIYTVYPLSMAWACAEVKKDMLVTMNQTLLLITSLGSFIAPLLFSLVMEAFGQSSLFICFIVLFAFYVAINLTLVKRKGFKFYKIQPKTKQ